jgi:hypothetical protein
MSAEPLPGEVLLPFKIKCGPGEQLMPRTPVDGGAWRIGRTNLKCS